MLAYFDRPSCPKHQLPFLYSCTLEGCTCSIRLCSHCVMEHPLSKDGKYDFIWHDSIIRFQSERSSMAKWKGPWEELLASDVSENLVDCKSS